MPIACNSIGAKPSTIILRAKRTDLNLRIIKLTLKMQLKSQSAMEFVILASFMLLVILGFFSLASSKMADARQEGSRKTAEDIAGFAYREVEIAKTVNDGYSRIFEMPQAVNGVNYSIAITDGRELVVNYLDEEYVKFLPINVTGNILKGSNRIAKINGIIFIN